MLPAGIKWPLQFSGAVVKAWLLVQGAKLGYALMGGGRPGLWGAFVGLLLTLLVVGLLLLGLRRGLGRLAEWLVRRTVTELDRQRSPVDQET